MPVIGSYRLTLLGPFGLFGPDGPRIQIPSKKARVLLAALALSPRGERSRIWIQDLLWSRCERQESQNSLRRELSNLRKILGPHGQDLIETDSNFVRLRLDLCQIAEDESTGQSAQPASEFLEGIDLAGEEPFEDWLRTHRMLAAGRRAAVTDSLLRSPPPQDDRLCLALLPILSDETDCRALVEGDLLVDRFAACLVETGTLDVVDYRAMRRNANGSGPQLTGPDLFLSLVIARTPYRTELSVRITQSVNGRLMLTRKAVFPSSDGGRDEVPRLDREIFVHEAINQLLHVLTHAQDWQHEQRHRAGRQTFCAIEQMFSLAHFDLGAAESNLDAACAIRPHGTIFAWRAYSTVFRLDDPASIDHRRLCEEATEYSRRALELDPYNGLALSLLAHVYSFVMRDFGRAADFLDRAKALKCEHVMAHDAEALFKFYTGDLVGARRAALRAETAGRHLPYRYCFVTTLCMIEALRGNFAGAIGYGERALSLQPSAAGALYAPTLRYLGASYSASRQPEAALEIFGKLKKIDPRVSSAGIDPRTYPTPSAAAATFIQEGLQRVAM